LTFDPSNPSIYRTHTLNLLDSWYPLGSHNVEEGGARGWEGEEGRGETEGGGEEEEKENEREEEEENEEQQEEEEDKEDERWEEKE
jgi:hypothetical protein